MSKIENLIDFANAYGFEAIDDEIRVWIVKSGVYDEAVRERMAILNEDRVKYPDNSLNQQMHRMMCVGENRPYGWEFCYACSTR